jgi:peptide/nickel transport system substrate-binding protein
MRARRLFLLLLSFVLSLACVAFPLLAESEIPPSLPAESTLTTSPFSLATPTLQSSQKTLTICAGAEPADLFLYNGADLVKQSVLAALYDGPIEYVSGAYQPVLLQKLPSLADGDAVIEAVDVFPGDLVLSVEGTLAPLQPGLLVRPAGCRSDACAVAYEGGSFQMDRLRVIFHLRTDVFWEDGEPLTAWDSVFSYRVASDPETLYGNLGLVTGSPATLLFTADYSALDDYTVQWTGRPGFLDPNYPVNFFHPLPAHILSAYSLSDLLASNEALYRPAAWGAYRIVDWKASERIVLEPNPAYFRRDQTPPAFDQLIFRFIGQDPEAALAELTAGTCDLLLPDSLPPTLTSSLLELLNAGAAKLIPDPQPFFEYLLFDINPTDLPPIFADPRMRQAVASCLDRSVLADAIYAGYVPALELPLPADDPLLRGLDLPTWPYDPGTGMALLEQVGWLDTNQDGIREAVGVPGVPDGTPLQFTLYVTDAPLRDQLARWLTFQLQTCGMRVDVFQAPARELLAQTPEAPLSGRHFQMAVISAPLGVQSLCSLAGTKHISSEMTGWSGLNRSGYSNPALDSACEGVLMTLPGEADYLASRQEVLRILSQDLPILPLFVQTRFIITSPLLAGLEHSSGLQDLEKIYTNP